MGAIKYDVYLFDIDGVLNEPQKPVPLCMQTRLQSIARHRPVYFVTGNTYTKAVDLINGHIAMYSGIFCNNADELRSMRGKLIWEDKDTDPLPEMQAFLNVNLYEKSNNSFEWRTPRMVNVSKIGRFASQKTRDMHDASWRSEYISRIKKAFPLVEAVAGGAVSVDIYSKGADKSRACRYINSGGKTFAFIGDKTDEGGNDFCVKRYCDEHKENLCLTSSGVEHTMYLLDKIIGEI